MRNAIYRQIPQQGNAMSSKYRVLIVDDHPRIREVLRNLLDWYDDIHIVGEAGDGEEAIDSVAACQPDVIVMDMNMPRMNGMEATGVIKKYWSEVLIIGMCVIEDVYTMDAFMKAGASAVVAKNRINDLYPTIIKICGAKASSIAGA
jgi:NarL family two-component system response regulator LiaR